MSATVHHLHSLLGYNTFGLDVKADFFSEVQSVDELKVILSNAELKKQEQLILGGGSNILFTTNFHGLVIHNCLKGIEVVNEDDQYVYVKSASGEIWHDLVLYTIEQGWGGLENLSLIPGSVGASPMQNIGAYGVETKDSFQELEALDLETLELHKFDFEACKFGYRESIFKQELRNRYFITSVTFRVSKNPVINISYGAISQQLQAHGIVTPTIKDVSDAVIAIRRSKLPDPKILGNAGSFFKNPEIAAVDFEKLHLQFPTLVAYALPSGNYKLAAGWMIEQCGWKGKRVGETGAHRDQALVIVNYGYATGTQIQELAMEIRNSVHEKFGVWITPEVNIV